MSMFMVRNLLDRLIRDLIYCAIADLIGEIQLNPRFLSRDLIIYVTRRPAELGCDRPRT